MKARSTGAALLSILILTPSLAGPAPAAEEPPADPRLAQEVWRLNATLTQLVALLRRQVESGNAAVLMQRVQLMTARIAPLEDELRSARSTLQGFENELDELEIAVAAFEAQTEREVERGEMTAEEARAALDRQMVDQRRKQIEDRLWEAKQRVIDLEQRLDTRRKEIETWEGEIDRALGLR